METKLFRALRKSLSRFATDNRGNMALIFALATLPIVGSVGAAVDYSRANGVKTALQNALDSAVLAGAGSSNATRDSTAQNVFAANFTPKVHNTAASASFTSNNNGTYVGTATASVPTSFVAVFGMSKLAITATATAGIATVGANGNAYCILALNATAQSAIDDSASSQMNASKCIVQVNSSNSKAVTLSGSAQINSAENCFVGGASTSGSAKITPPPDAVCKKMADPFANMSLPYVGACDHTNYQPKDNETLQPGVYCSGLNISSVSVSFAPGLYIIKDGSLQPSGGSTMTGTGVSFFLTGKGAGVNTSGSSSWHISAMTSGTLAGFVFFLDPNATPASSSTLSGTSELYFEGVLYFAHQQLNLSGGSSAYPVSPFASYIADTFVLSGSSALTINSDASKTSMPVPSALLAGGTGGKLRLIN